MKLREALFNPVGVAVLAAAAAGAVWLGGVAHAVAPWSTTLVATSGTVTGQPESVVFSGQATISSRLAPDPDFNTPSYVISIDLGSLSGVGSSTAATYVISGPEIVLRRVAPSHAIEITFPFVKSGMGLPATRSGVASFVLNFDAATGAVTSGSGSVKSPAFP